MSELWDFTAPERDEDRPSDLELDRLRAGELDAGVAARIEARLAESPEDQLRFEALDRHFDDMPDVDERRMLAAIRRGAEEPASFMERVRANLFAWVGAVVTVAAAVTFFALRSGPVEPLDPPPLDTVALKGAPALHVQRRGDDGRGQPIDSGQAVRPGDTLKFTVDLPVRARVRLIGVEQSGDRYDVWPLDGGPSPVLDRGERIELGGAVTLDDAPGQERLYFIACPEQAEPEHCSVGGPTDPPSCAEGCRVDTFVLDKKAP